MLDAEQCNNIKKELSKALSATVSHGYFIIDKKKGKNSVVGFLIYNIKEQTRVSYLLFVLIDKKYQNQSFGTTYAEVYGRHSQFPGSFGSTVNYGKNSNRSTAIYLGFRCRLPSVYM